MWREGGYLCTHCGCQADLSGKKLEPEPELGYIPMSVWVIFCGALFAALLILILAIYVAIPWVEENALAALQQAE